MIVSELAKIACVTPHAVRYYSRIGLLCPAKDVGNNYRRFARDDVQRLNFIKKSQQLGFTLEEIAILVKACERIEPVSSLARDIVTRHIAETAKEMRALSGLQQRMRRALEMWKLMPDGVPDGEIVCELIETLATG